MAVELRSQPAPRLVDRARELASLGWPEARVELCSGKMLRYFFDLQPGRFGQMYSCMLRVTPDGKRPDVVVRAPDLVQLACGRDLPHIYPDTGIGTMLCLWWPRGREWVPHMSLLDTFIPWTAEWLQFFEDWLFTDEWGGGGQHPRAKRWGGRPLQIQAMTGGT